MTLYHSSSNQSQDALGPCMLGVLIWAIVAAATALGYTANLDLSLSLQSEHNLVRVELQGGAGLPLISGRAVLGTLNGG